MVRLKALIIWFARMWPGYVPFIIGYCHYWGFNNISLEWVAINEIIALALQIIGGILVLYAIDSNLGIASNTSLFGYFWNYLKAIPCFSRNININAGSANINFKVWPAKIRQGLPSNTLEEKIAYLELKIDWLKEDLQEEANQLKERIRKSDKKTNESIRDIHKKIKAIDHKVTQLSVGDIKLQIFGVLLFFYGNIVNYIF